MATSVYLGLERGTDRPVREPIGHLAIFGQTRRAGKTTSLRTLVATACAESDAQALIFRTGSGEISFTGAQLSTPFFRDRVTWQGVETMLWTFLAGEKPKTYRPILMKAVSGAKSLEDVHRNIVYAGTKAKNGWLADRTFELDTYFTEILPWLRQHRLASSVFVGRQQSVVDLVGWPLTAKQLVIASTLEALMDAGRRSTPLLVVLPEARNFIPSDSKTPVTRAADRMAREGAKLNLFLWIDSQALTGVDQQVLRNFALQLQGVQTSDLELSRVAKAFEVPAKDVRSLKVGDFILHTDDGVRTVHVPLVEPKEDPNVDATEREEFERRLSIVEEQLRVAQVDRDNWKSKAQKEHDRAESNANAAAANAVEAVRAAPSPSEMGPPGSSQVDPHDIDVTHEVPTITARHKLPRVETDTTEMVGRIALLITENFWRDGPKRQVDAGKEFVRRGFGKQFSGGGASVALSRAFAQMTLWGFLRRDDDGAYSLVPGVRDRVVVVEER